MLYAQEHNDYYIRSVTDFCSVMLLQKYTFYGLKLKNDSKKDCSIIYIYTKPIKCPFTPFFTKSMATTLYFNIDLILRPDNVLKYINFLRAIYSIALLYNLLNSLVSRICAGHVTFTAINAHILKILPMFLVFSDTISKWNVKMAQALYKFNEILNTELYVL